jgi:hypothetical protein
MSENAMTKFDDEHRYSGGEADYFVIAITAPESLVVSLHVAL